VPTEEKEFNKKLLNYNSVTVKEILARYRNQYPELVNMEMDMEIRTEVEKFSEKVNVNVEFFTVR